MLLASFDPEFARTIGRNPVRADALLYALLGSGDRARRDGSRARSWCSASSCCRALARAARRARARRARSRSRRRSARVCSVGGFALAYRVDLPTGPTSVALAAGCWIALTAARPAGPAPARCPRARCRGGAALLALGSPGTLGCGLLFGMEPAAPGGLARHAARSRGPAAGLGRAIPERHRRRRCASRAAIRSARRSARSVAPRREDWTVVDALQAQAVGRAGAPRHRRRTASRTIAPRCPEVPADAGAAARARARGRPRRARDVRKPPPVRDHGHRTAAGAVSTSRSSIRARAR